MGRVPGWLAREAAIALVVGGLTHLAAVFVLAGHGPADSFRTVSALGHGRLLRTFAGPGAADRRFPDADPAMATAFCLFDLATGPVTVRLDVTPLDFAALSVHGAHGEVRYALDNSAAVGSAIALRLTRPEAAVEDAAAGAVRVALPAPQGFVMAQALARMPSARAAAEAMAGRLVCRTDK